MVWDTQTVNDVAWEYPFTVASDTMAIEFAERHAKQAGKSLNLFNTDQDYMVATIKVKTTVTTDIEL